MGTISEKLTYLNDTKQLLKDSINSLGGDITSQTTFRQYATELDSIYASLPKVSGTGSNISLTPTLKGRITSTLKGNTLQDGTPSPSSPVEIQSATGLQTIDIIGKNLFDVAIISNYSPNLDMTISNNSINKKIYEGNASYTIKNTQYNINKFYIGADYDISGTTPRFLIRAFDSNGNQITSSVSGWTYLSFYNAYYRDSNGEFDLSSASYIQVGFVFKGTTNEIGKYSNIILTTSTNTTYEAYQSQTKQLNLGTIKLNKIGDYQDYITGTPDNWSIKRNIKKYSINTSQITLIDNYSNLEYASFPKASDFLGFGTYDKIEIISNKTQWTSSTSWNSADNINKISGNANQWNWWLGFEKGTGLTTIQQRLENTDILYPITETTETITDTELIEDLNNLYYAQSYNDTTNISVEGDLPMILDVSALKGVE